MLGLTSCEAQDLTTGSVTRHLLKTTSFMLVTMVFSLLPWFVRIPVVALPVSVLEQRPGFQLRWIWYLSVLSVTLQVTVSLLLLRREFRRRLGREPESAVRSGGTAPASQGRRF